MKTKIIPTCTHWGSYLIEKNDCELLAVHAYENDLAPAPFAQSLLNSFDVGCRIAQPMVRSGYLEHRSNNDGTKRGIDPFVPVSWELALDLAAEALIKVKQNNGNEAIYGGSYGWSSAGRFHHGQSQVHRFLNQFGGYTYSVDSYSFAAAEVIMPYVLGVQKPLTLLQEVPTIKDIANGTKLMVSFGGMALKNIHVAPGGLGAHTAKKQLMSLKQAGVEFINISPIKDDIGDFLSADWWSCRPNSDMAIMLGIAHTLVIENLHDMVFLEEYCVGFNMFLPYLLGEVNGQPKNAKWAAELSEIPAKAIQELAIHMAKEKTLITVSASLQRAEHGEQVYWMATVLGSMLGYLGLPGAGVAYGYGCMHSAGFHGRRFLPFKVGSLPQGKNPINSFIPSSRISDMLLNPGGQLDYNGQQLTLPDIKLIYWVGGNPFHHHQDLNRLRKAWAKPETIICHESVWTATARHADIVFPSTTFLERNDFGGGSVDTYLSPMRQALDPYGESRDDYTIFSELANRLGFKDSFTEGRSEMQWIKHLYDKTHKNAQSAGIELPEFDVFWNAQRICLENKVKDTDFFLELFRRDKEKYPLKTPSGKIEIFSKMVANYQYENCHEHPRWYDKTEWLGSKRAKNYPLHLISNQPKTRLHSQYDHGIASRNSKIKEREPARMNPKDATDRGIKDGDVIRLFNDRGACLAGVELSDLIRPGVIQLATGAWYDPEHPEQENSLEVHGNPNVLTKDLGTSKLAQGPTAHSCLVQVDRFDRPLPPVKVFKQPKMSEKKSYKNSKEQKSM